MSGRQVLTNKPLWTEQLFRPRGGQDHLGLGSVVTDRMLPMLAPGINVLTRHPRYWSFYAFVVHEFWKGGHPQNTSTFRKFLRHKESIFAAANLICDPNPRNQVIGTRRLGPLVESRPKSINASFDYMKSAGGGYGLYYATAMQATGAVKLANRDVGLPIDAVTPDLGKPLADAFRDSITETRYFKKYLNQEVVPTSVIEEYGQACSLWSLAEDSEERMRLVDVILHGGSEADTAFRRKTLQMMLEISVQTARCPLNEDLFRQLVLYRSAMLEEGGSGIVRFRPGSDLKDVSRYWRISQLREMFNWSLNGIWRWVAVWGAENGGEIGPVPLRELESAVRRLDLQSLRGITCSPSRPIGELVEQLSSAAEITQKLDGEWKLQARISEISILRHVESDSMPPRKELAHLFSMYLLALLRVKDVVMDEIDTKMIREGGAKRIGMASALRALERDISSGRSIAEVVLRVITESVVTQHERIAIAKLPDDTFRFRRDGSTINFFGQTHEYRPNDSRYRSIASACGDLRWTTYMDEGNRKLSEEGEMFRTTGDVKR